MAGSRPSRVAILKPRILVIIPVSTDMWNEMTLKAFRSYLTSDIELDVVNLEYGPPSIETDYDIAMATPFIVREAEEAEKRGYNAIIIDCFEDPGLHACREAVSVPVVGPGEAALHLASILGKRFSIITVGRKYVLRKPTPKIYSLGLANKFASERSIGVPVLDIGGRRDEILGLLIDEGRRAIEEDGADTLVLGCTGLMGFREKMEAKLGVPVIYPGEVAVKLAEFLVLSGYAHSKLAYPKPSPKPLKLPT